MNSVTGRFAPSPFRPQDVSPPAWMLRLLDDSPHTCGRFAPWTFRPKHTVLGISPSRRGRTDGRFAALTHVSVKSYITARINRLAYINIKISYKIYKAHIKTKTSWYSIPWFEFPTGNVHYTVVILDNSHLTLYCTVLFGESSRGRNGEGAKRP